MATRNIKLEGRALEIARDIALVVKSAQSELDALEKRAKDCKRAAGRRVEDLEAELRKELQLERKACMHLDIDYMEEHGLAFVKTGCSDKDDGPLSGLAAAMEQALNGRRH